MTLLYRSIALPLAAVTLISTCSCKVYNIPVDSFREQFAAAGPEKSHIVRMRSPLGTVSSYATYPMDYIYCENNAGKKYRFPVGPALTISFTDTNNKRTPFYLDLISVDSAFVSGYQMRLIGPAGFNAVPLGAVKKITIHHSKKKFAYVQ